ncbi:MAG: hypothetical protein WC342_04075 [Methanoregula sp.]|jgi:hypothetical protein
MNGNGPISQTIRDMHTVLTREIHEEHDKYKTLYASGTRGRLTLAILGGSVLFNILLFFIVPIYSMLFISASFVLFMVYFVTLLIPHDMSGTAISKDDITRYYAGLKNNGIFKSSQKFTKVFLNAFFINCRPLFPGFALIFILDIIIVLVKYAHGTLSLSHTWIILVQCCTILVFYAAIWKFEPYSTAFSTDVKGMRQRLIYKNIPEQVVTVLFIIGAGLAIASIILAIFLLPGITFSNVLSVEELNDIGHVFVIICAVVASLYFIFRYIHGITSRDILTRFSERKEECLLRQIEITGGDSTGTGEGTGEDTETLAAAAELLLESRIYQVEKKTIFGTFPVYIVNPDFTVILEENGTPGRES